MNICFSYVQFFSQASERCLFISHKKLSQWFSFSNTSVNFMQKRASSFHVALRIILFFFFFLTKVKLKKITHSWSQTQSEKNPSDAETGHVVRSVSSAQSSFPLWDRKHSPAGRDAEPRSLPRCRTTPVKLATIKKMQLFRCIFSE